MGTPASNTSHKEFIALMATTMSLMALSIDAMLPALNAIGSSLQVTDPNDNQLVISSMFLGMSVGLMLYGPIADSFGRKKAIYLGVGIFLIGDLISLFAQDFSSMIVGRLLQGFGAAACRVVSITMIRDKFSGKEMARIMSLIMMIFIMVPALAPALGQFILLFSSWRTIFVVLLLFAVGALLWLHLRQEETLAPEHRKSFSFPHIKSAIVETLKHPISLPYTVAAGIMFGSFVGYLSSSQQIIQLQYQTGELFALYFGILALAVGISSFINSKLVMKYPLEKLCQLALSGMSLLSIVFFIYAQAHEGQPSFLMLMLYFVMIFFCFGLLFGSFNTLAIQPLGHIAGIANSVISTLSTLISVFIGTVIGQLYDGTVLPLVSGYVICSICSLVIILRIPKQL
ncbi:MAG: multidrug effflux MFS transporter [Cycloclasticus sp.]